MPKQKTNPMRPIHTRSVICGYPSSEVIHLETIYPVRQLSSEELDAMESDGNYSITVIESGAGTSNTDLQQQTDDIDAPEGKRRGPAFVTVIRTGWRSF